MRGFRFGGAIAGFVFMESIMKHDFRIALMVKINPVTTGEAIRHMKRIAVHEFPAMLHERTRQR
jgi:hypothetical protein